MSEPEEAQQPAPVPIPLDREVSILVGDCRCPGAPHAAGDIVWLWRETPMEVGIAAYGGLDQASSPAEITVVLGMAYLRFGISRWSFVDESGLPEPVATASIKRLLPWSNGGFLVADAAAALYDEDVTRPLVERLSGHSNSGRTEQSISPNRESRRHPPRRSA